MVVKDGVSNGAKQLDLAVKVDEENRVTDIAVDYCASSRYLASMGIFVISRSVLMHEVAEAVPHNRYHFERDLVMHGFAEQGMKINAYRFDGVALFNESTTEFFHNSLALIEPEVRHGLFSTGQTIYTKVRDEVPAYYGEHSEIDDCIVADGCVLEGRAKHIGAGADLECVILDKDVVVRPGAVLRGTKDHPLVFKRGAIV